MAYNKEIIFPLILSEMEEGASLRSILRRDDMPGRTVFFEWLSQDEIKANQYALACEKRSEFIFDEILEISDQDYGTYFDEIGNTKIDSASVNKKRLQIDARKWMLGKMNPKKYGDKLQTEQEIKQVTMITLTDATINTDS